MAIDMQPVTETLTSLLGPQYVWRDPEVWAYFSRDLSWESGEIAEIVIQPGSAEELAADPYLFIAVKSQGQSTGNATIFCGTCRDNRGLRH